MGNITLRVVTDLEEFRTLAGVWNELLGRCGDENSIYLTHERLFIWWQHFGEGKKLHILLIEKNNQVIAIVPLMRLEYRVVLVRLYILETLEADNINYIWICPLENRKEAVAALFSYLREALHSNLALKLRLVPEESGFLALLREQVAPYSSELWLQVNLTALAPYIKLPETWEEYLGSISRKRRAVLRQALRRLEDSHCVKLREYTADSLEDGLDELFTLHQRRWQSVGIKSPFYKPEIREFYKDCAKCFFKRGWLYFSCLTVDNKVVSSLLSFVYNRRFYAAVIARDRNYAEYSVGHLHYMYLIEDAIGKKLREFDFLKGDEPYKFYWTKTTRKYLRVVLARRSLVPWLYLKYLGFGSLFKQIKQSGLRSLVRASRKQ